MRVSLSFVLLHMNMIMIVKLDDKDEEGYDNHVKTKPDQHIETSLFSCVLNLTYRDGDYDAEDGDFDVEDEFVF